jgi:hypothetical protein
MKNLIKQYIPEVDDMRLIRILSSEDTAAAVLNDRRCEPDSFLVYSIDSQVDCVWLTPTKAEWEGEYGMVEYGREEDFDASELENVGWKGLGIGQKVVS